MMLYSIQAYRALAVLLVVLFHGTIRVERLYGIAPFHDVFSLGFSGVHLVFVLSGFIILTAHVKDIGEPGRLFWYLKRRLIRIYPIYWIMFFVLGGWKLVSVEADIQEFALNAFLFMSNTRLVIPVSWTLLYEIIFYAIFAVLVVNKRIGLVVIAVWCSSVLLSWGSASHHILHPFNLMFIFGLLASVLFLQVKKLGTGATNTISALSFGLGAIIFVGTAAYYSTLIVDGSEWPAHPVTIIGFGLATVLLVLGTASPSIEHFFRQRHLLGLIGNASYAIYLVHVWAQKTAFKLVQAINPMLADGVGESQVVSDLLLILIAVVAALCGVAIHLKVERPLLSFVREKMNAGGRG
jgi:exopolysaccharide production protein ExoZ